MGIVAYAFRANSTLTRNRPEDEHRFQIKYGSKDNLLHEIWQDPFGLYTTLFCGINPEHRFFVGADPVLHSPTKFFISLEFKQHHVEAILASGWHVWERERINQPHEPVEVLVGGTPESFLRYVMFEREALGEDQGHRQLLAETIVRTGDQPGHLLAGLPSKDRLHTLADEFQLSPDEVLDLIAEAPRLKMAVRGWVAEEHLYRALVRVPGVADAKRIRTEGGADIALRFGGVPLEVECKNCLRQTRADGTPRVDFQRTRASKADPCSRYYAADDFDVVAACLHAVTLQWEFRFALPSQLDEHRRCSGKLSNLVQVDQRWHPDARRVLEAAATR